MALFILTTVVALLGIGILLFLFSNAKRSLDSIKLKKQNKLQSVADLLNYASLVEDGILVNKNGSLTVAFLYRGEDSSVLSNIEQSVNNSHINEAVKMLGDGWLLHIDAVRRESREYTSRSKVFFENDVAKALDEEKRQHFNKTPLFEGNFILTLTFTPPLLAEQKLLDLLYEKDDEDKVDKKDYKIIQTSNLINKFKNDVKAFVDRMSVSYEMHQLKSFTAKNEVGEDVIYDDLLAWLHYCVTGKSQKVALPPVAMYLDRLIGGQEFVTGTLPKIGDNYIKVINIGGFPSHSYPSILKGLGELATNYRWSTRFHCLDYKTSLDHMNKLTKKWRQKQVGFLSQVFNTGNGRINQDAVEMTAWGEQALSDIESGAVMQGYYTSNVIIMGEDPKDLDERASIIAKFINDTGFSARVESVNAVEAYMGSLPGHGYENVRRPIVNSINLTDLMPTSSIWSGLKYNPCDYYPEEAPPLIEAVTAGRSSFKLNLHVADVGHTLIVGPTGSGKSVLLGSIAHNAMKYQGMKVFAFDVGWSMYALCKALGGNHYYIGGEDDVGFAPIQSLINNESDRSWLSGQFIESILTLNGVTITPQMRNDINAGLDAIKDGDEADKTLTNFNHQCPNPDVRSVMRNYMDGSLSNLFNAKYDSLKDSNFTVFDIEELQSQSEKVSLPVLLYLFRRIENEIKTGTAPSLLILDEAWLMLKNPVFKDKIVEWLRTLRRSNCAVILASQNIDEAIESGLMGILNESCKTKILLPNPELVGDSIALYKELGLTKTQISTLSGAIQKRDYYYISTYGKRLFQLDIPPVALELVSGSKEKTHEIKALEAEYGDEWLNQFLNKKGLSYEEYVY